MTATPFLLVYLLMALYACSSQVKWLQVTLVASFFQAASPLAIAMGGGPAGLQPGYALIPIGIFHAVAYQLNIRPSAGAQSRIDYPALLIAALTLVVCLGGLLLPRVFSGFAHVTSPRLHNAVTLLEFQTANLVQSTYMLLNYVLYSMVAKCVRTRTIDSRQYVNALALGTLVSCALGVYQIASEQLHLPWPDSLVNSNPGAAQLFNQQTNGMVSSLGVKVRMSSTFLEPSFLAVYFLGMFGMFCLGLKRLFLSLLLLFCLLISTSTTALLGLSLLLLVWGAWRSFESRRPGLNRSLTAIFALCLVVFFVFAYVTSPREFIEATFIGAKQSTESGQIRSSLDSLAIPSLVETYGFGVGIGSTRLSSFLTTFAACCGVPGTFFMAALFITLLVGASKSAAIEVRALGAALLGIIIGWFISVPDISLPMIWLLAGLIGGELARSPAAANANQAREDSNHTAPKIVSGFAHSAIGK